MGPGIGRWLKSRGFLLEMEVAKVLAEGGWAVAQSEPYEDPKTGKPRETDVNARLQRQVGDQLLSLELVIECKTSESRPWILLCTPVSYKGSSWVAHTTVSHLGQMFLNEFTLSNKELLVTDADRVFADLPLFAWPAKPAFRFVEGLYEVERGHHEQRDGAFTAVLQLSAALNQYNGEASSRPPWLMETICEFLIPVVVVNENLFECSMGVDGSLTLELTHCGVLIASRDLESPLSNYILVVDLEGFRQLCKDGIRTFEKMVEVAPTILPEATARLRQEIAKHISEQGRVLEMARKISGIPDRGPIDGRGDYSRLT